MSNGLNVAKQSETWRILESPLLEVDPVITSFADRVGMHLSKNSHNWPERTIAWSSRGLQRAIQIALDDPKKKTYCVRAWASGGVGMTWRSRELYLKKRVGWPEIALELDGLLAQALDTAEQWSEESLNASRRVDVGTILRRHRP